MSAVAWPARLTFRKSAQELAIAFDDGTSETWTHLVIATGSRVRPLPVPGTDLDGVRYLRTIADVDRVAGRTRLPHHRPDELPRLLVAPRLAPLAAVLGGLQGARGLEPLRDAPVREGEEVYILASAQLTSELQALLFDLVRDRLREGELLDAIALKGDRALPRIARFTRRHVELHELDGLVRARGEGEAVLVSNRVMERTSSRKLKEGKKTT